MPSALAAAEVATTPSAARSVWASPLYRGATVALFLSGLGTSAAAPQITLFLVNDLHVSLTTAGLFYLTNITAPLAGYLIGARSDRSGKRLGLFRWCALAGFLGWVAMALADQVWMPFVISAVVLAFSGAAGSQLFAAVHDDLQTTANPVADGVVSIVRMALTAGWVVGPVLGSILATAAGSRVMLAATGSCALAQIVPMGFARTDSARPGAHTASASEAQAERLAQRPKLREMLPLLAFTGLIFSVTFRDGKDPATLLAANLIGATLGGFCEYLGMAVGVHALMLIIMAAYLASLLCRLLGRGSAGSSIPALIATGGLDRSAQLTP
jgi:SET family sugar efflux transporter-like MFS transporter